MSAFGDDEPEDAWHPDDDPAVLTANLRRRLALLDGGPAQGSYPAMDFRLAAWSTDRAATATPRQLIRALQLAVDLRHLRDRLGTT